MTTPAREKIVTWGDPTIGMAELPTLDGIVYLQKMMSGEPTCGCLTRS